MMNVKDMMAMDAKALEERKKVIEEKRENPNEPFELDGVMVRYRPCHSTRTMDTTAVHIGPDDIEFAYEHYVHPWNIFKPSFAYHAVSLNVDSEERAMELLKLAGVKGTVVEDPYADPARYHVEVGEDVLDVVKIWKIYDFSKTGVKP